MTLSGLALQGIVALLGVVMLAEGAMKLVGTESMVESFDHFGYPQWFRVVVGTLEAAGGGALLAGIVVNGTVLVAGGLVVAVVLVGAVGSHLRVGDALREATPAMALLVLALSVVAVEVGLAG